MKFENFATLFVKHKVLDININLYYLKFDDSNF